MRIALIHAMAPSIPPIVAAFGRAWPDATLMNLLDDSLAPAGLADCDVIALAQFSLSQAAGAVAAATGKAVLTTPDSAVRKLQRLLLPAKAA
ncbi:MAG TPA: hypothetical protein VHU42_08650 [Rhodopila sp.]|jgi:hypothetical protein|nr:hypothetical protein [Rhodopila sp.]